MHLSEFWHSKKNDCRLSRTQVIIIIHNNSSKKNIVRQTRESDER